MTHAIIIKKVLILSTSYNFTDEKIEAQKTYVTCPKLHNLINGKVGWTVVFRLQNPFS